jgi:hypothetical protein
MTDPQTPVIAAGIIRTGNLTEAETRYVVELEQYEARPAVLVVLPLARDVVNRGTLERARTVLDEAIARVDQAAHEPVT